MTKTILVFGDSAAWGRIPGTWQRYPRDLRWPYLLEGQLGREAYQVVDDAIPGRTTVFDDPFRPYRSGLAAIDMALIRHAPLDLVIIALGANDLQDLIGAAPEEIALGLSALIGRIRHFGYDPQQPPPAIMVLVPQQLAPRQGLLAVRFRSAAEKFPHLRACLINAAEANACSWFDLSTIVAVDPADGVHLSGASNRAIATALCEPVRNALAAAGR